MSTRSRGSLPRSPSTRRPLPKTRVRRSGRSPRSMTTCACCGRASACRTRRHPACRVPLPGWRQDLGRVEPGRDHSLPSGHPYKTTNPYTSSYLLGTDITCASTYGVSPSVSYGAAQGEQITLYVTKCQSPGTLTVELTVV